MFTNLLRGWNWAVVILLVGLVGIVVSQEKCPDNQESRGTCGGENGNCTDGYFCFKDACCPNCLTRVQAMNRTRDLPGTFVPQCDHTGSYLSEQCHYSTGECWCVSEYGEEIRQTRLSSSIGAQGRRDCEEERVKAAKEIVGATTESNGTSTVGDLLTTIEVNATSESTSTSTSTALEFNETTVATSPDFVNETTTSWELLTIGFTNPDLNDTILSTSLEMVNESSTTPSSTPIKAMRPQQDRPGTCPLVKPGLVGSCLTRCVRDSDCPIPEFKCCDNGCGKECRPAVIIMTVGQGDKPGRCKWSGFDRESSASSNESACSSDSECPGKEKCCSDERGELRCTADFDQDSSTLSEQLSILNGPEYNESTTCGPNTFISACANPCQLGCDQPDGPICPSTSAYGQCETGCECVTGYVRLRSNDTSSPCVEASTCGGSLERPPLQSCKDPYASWNDCGTACEETCESKPDSVCTRQCVRGCFCAPDYVKESNATEAKCIPRDKCPPPSPFTMSQPSMIQQRCLDPNALWSNCASACEETCRGTPMDFCRTLPCVSGCFCRPDYVRATNNPGAVCVAKIECNTQNMGMIQPGVVVQQLQCPDSNSIFLSCGTACEETCQGRPMFCSKQCVRGCFCKPGFVKESNIASAACIPRDRCFLQPSNPTPSPQQQRCQDPNAEFQTCGTACHETCDYRPTVCTASCSPGCFCKDGFVKETGLATANCVLRNQCGGGGQQVPPGAQNQRCADPFASWSSCGTACPSTCHQPQPQSCTLQCVTGCFCNDGYLKESDAPNARCVPRSMCLTAANQRPPPQPSAGICPDLNSQWLPCGSACQETCHYRPAFCTMQCVSGCFCNDGYVKESNSPQARCMAKYQCPPPQQSGQQQQQQSSLLKPGSCPQFVANPYFGQPLRQDRCRSDTDCQSTMKCCNTVSGFVCIIPTGSSGGVESVAGAQQCGTNQEYSPCPPTPGCVLTCENYNRPPAQCSVRQCGAPGCQCRVGHVLLTRGGRRDCVQPHLCFASYFGSLW